MTHHEWQKAYSVHNQTALQHLLRNKLNAEYFTRDKFNIYIYGFAYMNTLGNRSNIT